MQYRVYEVGSSTPRLINLQAKTFLGPLKPAWQNNFCPIQNYTAKSSGNPLPLPLRPRRVVTIMADGECHLKSTKFFLKRYNLKQARQRMYNVTLWSVRVTFIPPGYPNNLTPLQSKLLQRFNPNGTSIKNYSDRNVKCRIFLPDFNQIRIFLDRFS